MELDTSLAQASVKTAALVGVNLGGWLILERWMTPALFAGTDADDEYTFMQTPGAREKLRKHHREFIRDEDFKWMSQNGVEAVRIPVGYWVFDGDEPFISCIGRLDWAMKAAEKYNLKVLLSFHGAEGSQNGQDHSGRRGKASWYDDVAFRKASIGSLERLAKRYRDSPALWGIELLNEPKQKLLQRKLRRYYNDAYRAVAAIVRPGTHIVYHDAFTPRMLSAAISDDPNYPVLMDIHWYHFGFWLRAVTPLWVYFKHVVPWHGRLVGRLQRWQGIVVGEWSGIIAGQELNKFPETQHSAIIKRHIDAQMTAYRQADAWFYWSYKTEARGVWHFRSLVEDGVLVIPSK